jgi:glycosyltransferase involved in cell wall biosynthesis
LERLAFIVPCYNEQESIGLVIEEIFLLFPAAAIYVCDNNSNDRTSEVARDAGAIVLSEHRKGKGNAVRRLLRDVEADIYVMVDGDNTYNLSNLGQAIDVFRDGCYDLMTGDRFAGQSRSHFRKGHGTGNLFFTSFFRFAFGIQTRDVFSGLRIFSRRLVKTFPLVSAEFEIETELTIYAARMRLPAGDFPTSVRSRVNSESKLSTYRDGLKILTFSLRLLHREFPMRLYLPISAVAALIAVVLFLIPYSEYLATGQVSTIPTLVTSTIFVSIAIVSLFAGLILKEVSNIKYEQRYLHYLGFSR